MSAGAPPGLHTRSSAYAVVPPASPQKILRETCSPASPTCQPPILGSWHPASTDAPVFAAATEAPEVGKQWPQQRPSYPVNGGAELWAAAAAGDTAKLAQLRQQGVPVDEYRVDGATALHAAARHGNDASVKLLLEAGADKTIKDNVRPPMRPSHAKPCRAHAAKPASERLTPLPSPQSGFTALIAASRGNRRGCVDLLL